MTNSEQGFHFKAVDEEGLETLQVIADAKSFNYWMYSAIKEYCSGRILEIGSGIGNISELLLHDNHDLTISDIRDNYREYLTNKFPELAKKNKVINFDLVHSDFLNEYTYLIHSFDTVFALNVVEHIEDDVLAIANAYTLLKPGGHLVILVPAFQGLYNQLDHELYHFRRYSGMSLENLFTKNSVPVIKSFYFNAAGIPAWYISGKMQKNKTIPGAQMKLFNAMVPVFRIVDKLLFNKIGLSVICVGKKN